MYDQQLTSRLTVSSVYPIQGP